MSSITYSERIKIETFCELGLSNIQMGVRLNRSPSTISYELSRCQPYQAELAQTDAEYKRSRCGRKTKLSDELKQKILNYLRLSWSPGMIAWASSSSSVLPAVFMAVIRVPSLKGTGGVVSFCGVCRFAWT